MDSSKNAQLRMHLRLTNWTIILFVLPPLILFLLLALPITGNLIAIWVQSEIGCGGNAAHVPSCPFLGADVGGLIYSYNVGALALGVFNPFYAVDAVQLLVPSFLLTAWLIATLALVATRYRLKRGLRALANSSFKPKPLRGSA